MTNMRRWSDTKLEKEHASALAAQDENRPNKRKWLEAICKEMERRNAIDEGTTPDPR